MQLGTHRRNISRGVSASLALASLSRLRWAAAVRALRRCAEPAVDQHRVRAQVIVGGKTKHNHVGSAIAYTTTVVG